MSSNYFKWAVRNETLLLIWIILSFGGTFASAAFAWLTVLRGSRNERSEKAVFEFIKARNKKKAETDEFCLYSVSKIISCGKLAVILFIRSRVLKARKRRIDHGTRYTLSFGYKLPREKNNE